MPCGVRTAAFLDRSGTWRRIYRDRRSHSTPCTPFFPARDCRLPDGVGEVQSGIAKLQIDGSKFLSFWNIDGSLYELTNTRFELGPQFCEDRFDVLFAGQRSGS